MRKLSTSAVLGATCVAAMLAACRSDSTDLVVFAASSTTNVTSELTERFARLHGRPVQASFASSSTLARQLERGAHADLVVSANPAWMDYLSERGLIRSASRRDLAGNRLVLIAPAAAPHAVRFERGSDLQSALRGRMAIGDPTHVPAGIYAKQALEYFGWWAQVEQRLAPALDARAALALVERGEADLGVVYATDAAASAAVTVVGTFPAESHEPILYPAALCRDAEAGAEELLRYLSGPDAAAVFHAAGFTSGNTTR